MHDVDGAPGSASAMAADSLAATAAMGLINSSSSVNVGALACQYAAVFAAEAIGLVREELESASTFAVGRKVSSVSGAVSVPPPSYVSVASGISDGELEAREVEVVACGLVAFVCAIRDAPGVVECWTSSDKGKVALGSLVRLCVGASPRVQRMILQILSVIVPVLSVESIDATIGGESGTCDAARVTVRISFLLSFFVVVYSLLAGVFLKLVCGLMEQAVVRDVTSGAVDADAMLAVPGFGVASTAFARSLEVRKFLASCARCSREWKEAISQVVDKWLLVFLEAMSSAPTAIPDDVVRDALVALDILGASPEFIRVGGLVSAINEGLLAEVVLRMLWVGT